MRSADRDDASAAAEEHRGKGRKAVETRGRQKHRCISLILKGLYVYRTVRNCPNPERIVCKNVAQHIQSFQDWEQFNLQCSINIQSFQDFNGLVLIKVLGNKVSSHNLRQSLLISSHLQRQRPNPSKPRFP